MQPTYFEAHTPILLTKLLMQPAKLRFQDGCSQNHHPTYLLQSTHPKFVKPAADATHPTNLLFQDICPHSMQPADQSLISCNLQPAPCNLQPETYNLQPTTYNLHHNLQPYISDWMLLKSACSLPTLKCTPKYFNLQSPQPTNHLFEIICIKFTLKFLNCQSPQPSNLIF